MIGFAGGAGLGAAGGESVSEFEIAWEFPARRDAPDWVTFAAVRSADPVRGGLETGVFEGAVFLAGIEQAGI